MKPVGVQATGPMVPPGRQTRTSSSAAVWWCGANITPRQDSKSSNEPSADQAPSPTLQSKRLQQLVRAGLLTHTEESGAVVYDLTPAGQEVRPLVEAIGAWGVRWIGDLGDADLDPQLLLWDTATST